MPFLLPAIHSDIYSLQIYTVAALELYQKNIERISVNLQDVHIYIPGGFPGQGLHRLVSPSKPCHPGCEQLQDQPESVVCVNMCFRHIEIETIHLQ